MIFPYDPWLDDNHDSVSIGFDGVARRNYSGGNLPPANAPTDSVAVHQDHPVYCAFLDVNRVQGLKPGRNYPPGRVAKRNRRREYSRYRLN